MFSIESGANNSFILSRRSTDSANSVYDLNLRTDIHPEKPRVNAIFFESKRVHCQRNSNSKQNSKYKNIQIWK